jgi:hypothetical protein
MNGHRALREFMEELAAAVSAAVPSDVAVGVVGDWLVLTTSYGLDGYQTGFGLTDATDLKIIRDRVEGTLQAVQEIITRHLTEPWPVGEAGPVRSDSGSVWFPEAFVVTEGRTLHAFYAPRIDVVGDDHVEQQFGDIVLALRPLPWPS